MSKKPIAIHQFTPFLVYGDAISNYVIDLMKLLRSWGYRSDIYTYYAAPNSAKYCQHYSKYQHQAKDVLLYHYGNASEITDFILQWPDRLVLIYHNITPYQFFEFDDPILYNALKQAREELKALSVAPCSIGDSNYNCAELRSLGFEDVQTVPYLLNIANLDSPINKVTETELDHHLNDGYLNILFVGRIVPNKRQDQLIRLLAYFQKFITPSVRLLLVGTANIRYKIMLEALAEKLGVATDVHFVGYLKLKDGFSAYYKHSTVFISMSEHEGFGIPLLESMHFNLPVIAYNVTAVPETMGDAGILINEKRYDIMAELVQMVATDSELKDNIIKHQQERLQDFNRPHIEKLFYNWALFLEEKFG